MDRRNLRCGDWVKDPQNYGYLFEADVDVIKCANLFVPVEISKKFFEINGFKIDTSTGEEVFFRNEGEAIVTARPEEGRWRIEIHNGSAKYSARITYIHEVQHALSDCFVYWRIIAR